MSTAPWLPSLPFAATRAERAAVARERFFEHGQRPTGLVDEAVLQSWQRCIGQRRDRGEAVEVQPVSRLRLDTALRRTRQLREAAQGELQHLEHALSQTACTILLLDPQGLVVYASTPGVQAEGLVRAIARPGVDASEQTMGTNAPGLVLRTGQPVVLDAGEHYFDRIAAMRCAAAPIRDIHGRIAGVLDLTVEHVGFGFDPTVLVSLHAQAMERALLQTQSRHQTVVEVHVHPHALGAPGAGLLGVDDDGGVAWLDAAAERFTGAHGRVAGERWSCESVLGLGLAALRALASRPHPTPLPLPNGLGVWVRVRTPAGQAAPQEEWTAVPATLPAGLVAEPAAPMPPKPPMPPALPAASLADRDRALILETVRECGGNVSEAARRLGISRGRVYRALAP